MEINIHDNNKIVEIWLTNAEKNDPALQEKLKEMYRELKKNDYLVAVYESGTEDLYERTLDLLSYNKKRIAELEARKEKEWESPAR